jgi:hypothetical protein
MATTFDKLNLKTQSQIVVINAPAGFEPELPAASSFCASCTIARRSNFQSCSSPDNCCRQSMQSKRTNLGDVDNEHLNGEGWVLDFCENPKDEVNS